MSFVVGCDADGILTNLSEHNLREGKRVFQREPIKPSEYSLEDVFDVSDIPKPILYLKAFQIFAKYCNHEKPREYVSEVFHELGKEDFLFHSITARKFATLRNPLGEMSRNWFQNWLKKFDIPFSSIHYCSEENGEKEKFLACKKLNVDVMIDDKPEIALYIASRGIPVIMVDAPYNLDVTHENIYHASDWKEVKSILQEMKEKKYSVSSFVKKEKEEIQRMSELEKEQYFRSYKTHLKNLEINEEMLAKGEKTFKLIYSSIKYPVKAFYHVKVFGKENVPYQEGFIIASNHTDSTDQYRIGLAIGNRPFVGYAAKEIENTFRGRMFKATGLGVFVDRNDPEDRKRCDELMSSYVAHGKTALIFPEGTRKNKDKEGMEKFQNPFKLGTVSLAQKTGTGILPVATNAFGKDTVIRFGEMLYVNPTDDLEEKNKQLEMEIAEMSLQNMIYYFQKKNKTKELEQEIEKFVAYLLAIGASGEELAKSCRKFRG